MEFYSQYNQDKFIYENFFMGKENGVFIDIGACDGVDLSNTLFFEKNFNWTGVCIEPLEYYFNKLNENRGCICINGCITDFNGDGKFLEIEGPVRMLSGLVNSLSNHWLEIIDYNIEKNGGVKKEIDVKCYLLNDILEKNNFYNIDLCSIDTEGNEYNIIKTIDFNRFNIDVFIIENNNNTEFTKNHMENNGYYLVTKIMNDEIYKKK
jgi:FkbM family methyltransferase